MRALVWGLALLIPATLAGCASSDPSGASNSTTATTATESVETTDPAAAAESIAALRGYLLASDAGRCAAVKKRVLVPRDVECSDVRTGKGQWSSGGNNLRRLPMKAQISDDSASVTVRWKDGSKDTWDLQKADDQWLVLNVDSGDA